jgi:hypothetical protein
MQMQTFNKYQQIILIILITALSVISVYTSFHGLAKAFFGDISNVQLNLTGIFFLGFVGLIIFALQLIIVYAAFLFVYVNGFILSFAWILIFILAVSINTFFSYTFYYNLLKGDDFVKRDFISQVNMIQKSFQNLQSKIDKFADEITILAKYSNDIAKKEKEEGNTCTTTDIDLKSSVELFRNEEAKIFSSFVKDITFFQKKITKEIASIQTEINNSYAVGYDVYALQDKFNKKIDKFNNYKDQTLINVLVAINQHIGYNRNNIVVSRKNQDFAIIDCPDKNFENKAIAIRDSVMNLQKIDKLVIFNPKDKMALFFRIFDIITVSPRLFKEFFLDNEKLISDSNINDLVPLTIGLLFNLSILYIIFVIYYTQKLRKSKS